MNERTKEERRELGRKGGINSGKTRRKKASLKKAFEIILTSEVQQDKVKKSLDKLGYPATNEMALAITMFTKAMQGNVKAFENIMKLMEFNKDEYDVEEQKARIKNIEANTEKTKKDIASDVSVEDKLQQILEIIEDEAR